MRGLDRRERPSTARSMRPTRRTVSGNGPPTVLSLSASVAYAGDSESDLEPAANTQFTELPGVVAQAQVPSAPAYAQN